MKKTICLLILFTALYFTSCSSVTETSGTWKKPATVAKKYNKILVLGAMNDLIKRSTIEKSMVRDLKSYGINAVSGSDVLPTNIFDSNSDGKVDDKEKVKSIIATKLKELGVDGALVFSLKDVKEEERYVPGTTYYTPFNTYYPFYNYYWTSYEAVHTPGYYTKTKNVFFVTNFYDVPTETLTWSTQTETINPLSMSDFAKSYSATVIDDFLNSGIVKK